MVRTPLNRTKVVRGCPVILQIEETYFGATLPAVMQPANALFFLELERFPVSS